MATVLEFNAALLPRGPFDLSASYETLNFVESGGSGYVCLQPCSGIPVTNTAYWFKFVHKGDPGTPFTYADLTAEQKAELAHDATIAAQAAQAAAEQAAQKFATIKASIDAIDPQSTEGSIQTLAAKQGVLEAELDQLGPKIAKALPRDTAEDGLWICDASGKALLRLDTLDTKGGVGTNLAATIKGLIESAAAEGLTTIEASAIGETLTSLIQALIEEYAPEPTPTPSGGGNIMEVEEDGFYICNGNGQVIASWIDGEWDFGQGGGGGDEDEGCPKYVSALAGYDGAKWKGDMSANDVVQMTNYPYHEKKGTQIVFGGKISTFGTAVRIGKNDGVGYGMYAEVTADKFRMVYYRNATRTYVAEETHGLTISSFLNIRISFGADGTVSGTMQTLGGWHSLHPTTFDILDNGTKTGTTSTLPTYDMLGPVTAQTVGTAMTDCELSAHNPDFKCPIWLFGDSYFGVSHSRWIGPLKDMGYFNFYLNGLGGRSSGGALQDLQRALNWGTPKYLLFALITNDINDASGFAGNINSVLSICEDKGIIPIFTTQGALPDKNVKPLSDFIVSTGKRYIDFGHAVSANGWESGASWYSGLLDNDGVHPTTNGARTLAMQALKDMPELLQCVGGLE